MPVCIVSGCKVRTSTKSSIQEEFEKNTKSTFHAFPTCPTRRQLWQCSIRLENAVIPKRSVVCSLHFKAEDFDRTSLSYVRLKPGTIPYLNFPILPNPECPLKSPTGSRKHSVDNNSLNEPTEKVPNIVSPVKNECLLALLETSENSTQVEISLIEQSTKEIKGSIYQSHQRDCFTHQERNNYAYI